MSSEKQRGKKPPTNPQAALQAALDLVGSFLAGREAKLSAPERVLSQVVAGGKALDLDRESIRKYHELSSAFERYVELSRTLTLRSVKTSVDLALVNHFDHCDLAVTLKALRDELTKPARTFTVYVPVVGFDNDSVPGEVGGVPIISVADGEKRLLGDKTPAVQQALAITISTWPRSPPSTPAALFAITVENAAEGEAATEIALDRARRLVDVLHFFSDGHGLFPDGISVADGHGRIQPRSVVV